MKNLIKYEFRKTLSVKLILLGTAALAQLAFMIGLWTGRERIYSLGAFILLLLAFVGVAVIGLTSVLILHRDMNTKQSYMLFMTPNSCYKILGAKVIENGISLLLAAVFFFALGALDVSMLMAHEGRLADLWSLITQFLEGIDSRITLDTETLMSFAFGLLASWFSTVTCAYLADVVSTALLCPLHPAERADELGAAQTDGRHCLRPDRFPGPGGHLDGVLRGHVCADRADHGAEAERLTDTKK